MILGDLRVWLLISYTPSPHSRQMNVSITVKPRNTFGRSAINSIFQSKDEHEAGFPLDRRESGVKE